MRALRVAEPFFGLGTVSRLFETCGLSYVQVNACEIDARYSTYYQRMKDRVAVGKAGDITMVDVTDLEDADVLVGGA
eukprot:2523975-Pyramimonas_sp.AAC.1